MPPPVTRLGSRRRQPAQDRGVDVVVAMDGVAAADRVAKVLAEEGIASVPSSR